MFVRGKIQGIAKGFWRLVEVYLFFFASVFGFHVIAKSSLSYSSKSKEKSAEHRFCHSSASHIANFALLQTGDSGKRDLCAIENGALPESDMTDGRAFSESPFISPLMFYHLPNVTDAPASPVKDNVSQHPHLLEPPLLI
ncbi:MAG: hypothetical protein HGB19_03955 [Chlorobiales bacterium]|nr:hypothetical protein [Chlorobiales bacterium]